MSLSLLPPSFARCLAHVDAALVCEDAPNARPLLLTRVELRVDELDPASRALAAALCLSREDVDRTSLPPDLPACLDVGDVLVTTKHALLAGAPDDELVVACATVDRELDDEFVAVLRGATGEKIARFASSTAFIGPGELCVQRGSLDVFPMWRDHVPPSLELRLVFEDASHSDAARQVRRKQLVPVGQGLLLLGLEHALGDQHSLSVSLTDLYLEKSVRRKPHDTRALERV